MDFDLKFDNKRYTDEGWLVVDGFAASADDVYYYSDGAGGEYGEFRSFDAVKESLPRFQNKDLTHSHPVENGKQVFINSDNYKTHSVGHIDGPAIMTDDKLVKIKLVIKDKKMINDAENNGYDKLSVGYSRDPIVKDGVFDNKPYQVEQTNIQVNHVALVRNPRGGDRLKLKFDTKEFLFDSVEVIKPEVDQQIIQSEGKKTVMLKFDSHMIELEPQQEHAIQWKFDNLQTQVDDQVKLVADSKVELETEKQNNVDLQAKYDGLQAKFDADEKKALVSKVKHLFPGSKSFDGLSVDQVTEEAVKTALPDGNYDSKDKGYYQYKLEDILKQSSSNFDSQLGMISGVEGNHVYDSNTISGVSNQLVDAEMKSMGFGGKE